MRNSSHLSLGSIEGCCEKWEKLPLSLKTSIRICWKPLQKFECHMNVTVVLVCLPSEWEVFWRFFSRERPESLSMTLYHVPHLGQPWVLDAEWHHWYCVSRWCSSYNILKTHNFFKVKLCIRQRDVWSEGGM